MRRPLFALPSLRWPDIPANAGADPDPALGPPWIAGIDTHRADQLLELTSGLIRALHLAGYTVPTVRWERDSELVEVSLPNRVVSGGIAAGPAALDPLRATGSSFIALEVSPLPLFGPACHLQVSLPLSVVTAGSVHHIVDDSGLTTWLAVACPTHDFDTSQVPLRAPLLETCHTIADDIFASWDSPPVAGHTAGMAFVFDQARWQFPPLAATHRTAGNSNAIIKAWEPFIDHYTDDAELNGWLNDELAAVDYPSGSADNNRLAVRMDDIGKQAGPITEAYRRRLGSYFATLPTACADTADSMKDLSASDAVFACVEHGVFDPFVDIALRETPAIPIEWSDPGLTGTWVASDGQTSSVLLVNQAGQHIQGYLMFRVVRNNMTDIDVLAFSMNLMSSGGGISDYQGHVWAIDDSGSINDNSRVALHDLPPADSSGTWSITLDESGRHPILNAQFPGTYGTPAIPNQEFLRHSGVAHVTNAMLESSNASIPTRRRVARARASELHPIEQVLAQRIVDRIYDGVYDWAESWLDGVASQSMFSEMDGDVRTLLGTELNGSSTGDGARAIGRHVRWQLQLLATDDISALQLLTIMINKYSGGSSAIATLLGISLADPSGEQFRYRWRLTNVESFGGSAWVGATAYGVGSIEFQRFHEVGPEDGPKHIETIGDVIGPYPIHLTSGLVGFTGTKPGIEYGLGNISSWQYFEYAADRDLSAFFEGAEMSFTLVKGSVGPYSPRSGISVFLLPADGSFQQTCTVSAKLLSFASFDSDRIDKLHKSTEKWKKVGKAYRDYKNTPGGRMVKGGKAVTSLGFSATVMTTVGVIGNNPDLPAQDHPHLMTPLVLNTATQQTAMFNTDSHEVTPEFISTLRTFIAGHLPLFSWPLTDIDIDGHASHSGGASHNLDLSERRAVTMLEAVRNILGPQLAVSACDIRAVGHGETHAGGSPDSDRPQDRRTDLTLTGIVRLRV